MNRDTLKNIFNAPYQSNIWKSFLKELFRNLDSNYFQTPVDLKDSSLVKHKDVEHIWEFGDITFSDGKTIKFYEVVLKDNQQVTKNRVGLRNIVSGEIGFGYIDGAIITYHNHKAKDWRFTFISKSLYWDEDNNEVKTETHPKRYTYLLGQNETVKTAVNQFEWLFKKIETREIAMEDILKAFSVEKLSKEFYDGYFHQYETFVAYIVDNPKAFSLFTKQVYGNHDKAEKLVSDFVKKFLGRIVFLYFLQKKGWMGVPLDEDWGKGQRDFIFRLFEEFADKNNFYQKALVPLFFHTLNVDRSDNNDIFSVTNTRIPYLNGGLFEKDNTEPEDIQFEPQRFIELFAFFSKYNFTVDESSPDDQDIGVDPEMLGHIFENLLEDNKDKGAFYTPKEIVHYMTQECLIEYLHTHLPETNKDELTAFVKQKKKGKLAENELDEINSLLNKLKICDPAIGSGAFPMGLLHEIFALKGLIAFEQGYEAWSPARVKERIIENSIYGVDIEEGAVDIARLRFWLSLVVDEPVPRPLPNLDYKIICGNSLISRYALDTPINEVFKEFNKGREEKDKVDLEKYKALVRDYMHEANHDKKIEFKQLIEDIKAAFKTFFSKKELNKLNKLKGELSLLTGHNLFGNNKNAAEKRKITKLKKEVAKLELEKKEREEAKLYTNAIEWRFEFPNLLDSNGNFEGYDIVIGNPPYVDIKSLPKEYVRLLFEKFQTTQNRINLYSVFIEMGLDICNKDGIFSYIIPNSLLMNSSYAKIREKLVNIISKIIKLPDNVFVNAIVETIIVLANKKVDEKEVKGAFYRNNDIINFNKLKFENFPRKIWSDSNDKRFNIFVNPDISIITSKIENQCNHILSDYFDFTLGITPYDKYKGHSKEIIEERAFHSDKKLDDTYVPLISGSNITPYHVSTDIKEYLKYGDWLGAPRLEKFFTTERVIVRQIVSGTPARIFAGYTNEPLYHTQIGFSIIKKEAKNLSPKFLCALLNSKTINFYHKNKFLDPEKNTFQKILIENCKKFPLPEVPRNISQVFVNIVDYVLILNKLAQINEYVPNSHISETFEEVIDAMIFELYFPEEFKQVGISFINYAERDFKSIEGKSENEQRELVHRAYQKLKEKDNEIRNNLKAMKIELRDLLMPILTV